MKLWKTEQKSLIFVFQIKKQAKKCGKLFDLPKSGAFAMWKSFWKTVGW